MRILKNIGKVILILIEVFVVFVSMLFGSVLMDLYNALKERDSYLESLEVPGILSDENEFTGWKPINFTEQPMNNLKWGHIISYEDTAITLLEDYTTTWELPMDSDVWYASLQGLVDIEETRESISISYPVDKNRDNEYAIEITILDATNECVETMKKNYYSRLYSDSLDEVLEEYQDVTMEDLDPSITMLIDGLTTTTEECAFNIEGTSSPLYHIKHFASIELLSNLMTHGNKEWLADSDIDKVRLDVDEYYTQVEDKFIVITVHGLRSLLEDIDGHISSDESDDPEVKTKVLDYLYVANTYMKDADIYIEKSLIPRILIGDHHDEYYTIFYGVGHYDKLLQNLILTIRNQGDVDFDAILQENNWRPSITVSYSDWESNIDEEITLSVEEYYNKKNQGGNYFD